MYLESLVMISELEQTCLKHFKDLTEENRRLVVN